MDTFEKLVNEVLCRVYDEFVISVDKNEIDYWFKGDARTEFKRHLQRNGERYYIREKGNAYEISNRSNMSVMKRKVEMCAAANYHGYEVDSKYYISDFSHASRQIREHHLPIELFIDKTGGVSSRALHSILPKLDAIKEIVKPLVSGQVDHFAFPVNQFIRSQYPELMSHDGVHDLFVMFFPDILAILKIDDINPPYSLGLTMKPWRTQPTSDLI